MTTETAFGWRDIALGDSSGLDFLGLATPIEGILDAETSGITNATGRARYFSLVPWYYWKFAKQAGDASEKDQRNFAIGFEMLLAYANIAWLEQTETASSGIIRRDFGEKMWKEDRNILPLRGEAVGDTPSPIDAALYGPSLRRLNLLGRLGQFHTCAWAGNLLAEELDKTLGQLPNLATLLQASTVSRETVHEWAQYLTLEKTLNGENDLLRALLFSANDFSVERVPRRVYSMLLLLQFACGCETSFRERDIEIALATGHDLKGTAFYVDPVLKEAYFHWRILALLKFLRHASELAFSSVHAHVRDLPARTFASAEVAALNLIELTIQSFHPTDGNPGSVSFHHLVEPFVEGASPPDWKPTNRSPEAVLNHAINLAAWCQSILLRERDQELLKNDMIRVGDKRDADLAGYAEKMRDLNDRPLREALRWLLVDRGIARHFQVAARKLVQHDTFRLIEDEGVTATQSCPIADVAIRIDSMLSLLRDLRLLEFSEDGYRKSPETESWYQNQIARLS